MTSFNPEDVAARSSAFAKCALSCSACSLIRRHRTDKIQRERARASERERERKKERVCVQESESGNSKALVLTSRLTPRFDWVYVHQNTGEHTHVCNHTQSSTKRNTQNTRTNNSNACTCDHSDTPLSSFKQKHEDEKYQIHTTCFEAFRVLLACFLLFV